MSDSSIRIEYNECLQSLEEVLQQVQRPGDFFATGTDEIPMPKVQVAGVGVLSFPVPSSQVEQLIQQATRAPYGRGEETILDESVRKVWQLPPDKVTIAGKSWPATFDKILQQVITGLGCEGLSVSAQLYKLLVYDSGGFFRAHRDTEKAEGMFGTLVVVLPSSHRGGELVIRHAGREVVLDMSSTEASEAKFAAFYADCEHEVRPILEGNRVCLVYNLIHRAAQERGASKIAGPSKRSARLQAPDYEKQIAAAAALLEKHLSDDEPAKICWLLEHQYTPEGLSFAGLKSADAARVKVLAQAAERAGCAAHLGIVHIEESGSAEHTGFGYRPRRWSRYSEYGDEETDEDGADAAFKVYEVCDWRHYISHWHNPDDEPVEFGEIPLAPGELLPTGALDDEKPDEQRFMEATGNEGASFERSYHRATLVIWPRQRYAEVLLQAGVAAVLPYLQEKTEAGTAEGAQPAARKEAISLARQLVNVWSKAPDTCGQQHPSRPDKRDGMLNLLARLGDVPLLAKFIANVVTQDYDGSDNTALVACSSVLGAGQTGKLYAELAYRHTHHLHGHCIDLLQALTENQATSKRDWRTALHELAEAIVCELDQIGSKKSEDQSVNWRIAQKAPAVNANLVVNLLNTLDTLEVPALCIVAAKAFAARPQIFDPVTIIVPALPRLQKWNDTATRLWSHSADFLLKRSGVPLQPPKDWRQDVKFSCACPDCRELQAFAHDPAERIHRFRVNKDRRQHLHGQIDHHHLDMTHITDRKGSPQTLVCTKDRRSYKRSCEQYRHDIAALASLEELARKLDLSFDRLEKIRTARALATEWSESES